MFSSILFLAVFVIFFQRISAVTEDDILQYLIEVGKLKISRPNMTPHYYMDNALEGWTSSDKRVKELVGLVCAGVVRYRNPNINALKGCSVFESMAAEFLMRFYNYEQTHIKDNRTMKSMVHFRMRYHTVRVHYTSVRDMMPVICKRSESYLRRLDDITEPHLIATLMKEGNNLANDTIQYLKRAEQGDLRKYRTAVYSSIALPGGKTSLSLVKPMIPWMCDRYLNRTTLTYTRRLCEFFKNNTISILGFVSNETASPGATDAYTSIAQYKKGKASIYQCKYFIAHYCQTLPSSHEWKPACRYLLKEHMELLMPKRPSDMSGNASEEEDGPETTDEEDSWDEELSRYLYD